MNGWMGIENIGDFETKCAKMLNFREKFYRRMSDIKIKQQKQTNEQNEGLWKKTLAKAFPSGN